MGRLQFRRLTFAPSPEGSWGGPERLGAELAIEARMLNLARLYRRWRGDGDRAVRRRGANRIGAIKTNPARLVGAN
jgi:hypothetical protein